MPIAPFSQELSIWAYPKVPGLYEDALVCCVKENPEPIVFKLVSYGVRPELELDKKVLHFDKVLLHRSVCQLSQGLHQECYIKHREQC